MSNSITISWKDGLAMEARRPGSFSYLIGHARMIDPGARIYADPSEVRYIAEHYAEIPQPPVHRMLSGNITSQSGPQPLPYGEWPIRIKAFSFFKAPGDAGIGDTAARMAKGVGAEWMARKYEELTGHSCGCENKREWLNTRYPYAEVARAQ